ncbi:glycoside hydrolase family 2 protein [Paenibacillus dokdonensis]|uniref:glycoside hydrolase family 2 protein n=1 Tax=Paenibacillus dokdonensis TaxID=2567944 RepID=UPI0010A80435|nr:sugar-binding domain-containing protein [Paenibacillus dokdonensis]
MREQLSLNGTWQFRIDRKEQGERESWYDRSLTESRPVEVPHIWQREEEYVHYCGTAWYEKEFEAFLLPPGQKAFLCFGAVDFQARVWLNGEFIGEHEGGFTPFEFDVSASVRQGEINRLTVSVFDPQDNAEIPIGKQGSWYTRISGIWQEVMLETRPNCFIQQVHIVPDIDRGLAVTQLSLVGEIRPDAVLTFAVTGHLNPRPLVTESGAAVVSGAIRHEISIPDAQLWSPQAPHLYDLKVQLKDAEGRVMDEFNTYFGMRKIEFADGQLLLNHQPLFMRGALDQAFYPDTIYTAPSDVWIRNEIQNAKDMGFNLLRKHIKVEVPRYLYWADRMGMLIWAEPPNVVKWSEQSRRRFSDELRAMIDRDFNHPSILIWSLYNEEWGLEWDLANDTAKQEYVKAMYQEIKSLDPTRLICDNSGWIHVKTDINDYHRYFVVPEQIEEWKSDLDDYMAGNPEQNYVQGYAPNGEPIIISEFGVWGLPSVEKLLEFYKGEPSWFANLGDDTHREDFKKPLTAYVNFEKYQLQRIFGNLENLSLYSQRRMYRAVKSLIEEMRKRPQINGYVVTEFTDIEWETNGWMDYTRNLKLGMDHAADFNGSLVVMADGVNRNLWCGESQAWDILISNHDQRILNGEVKWEIPGTGLSGSVPLLEGSRSFMAKRGVICFTVPEVPESGFFTLKLTVVLDHQIAAVNEEELTISPRPAALGVHVCAYRMDEIFRSGLAAGGMIMIDELQQAEAVITSVLDEHVLEYYRSGGHVVFLAEDGDQLSEKGQFTFRELIRGESWDRTSSFNYVDPDYFKGIPLHHEMGWEMEGLYPDYIVPFSNYNKLGGTIGRVVYMFGNEGVTETSEIVSGYFQGWIGQAGGSLLVQKSEQGSLILTTWKLKNGYGIHPIATQVVDSLIQKCRN